MTKTSLVLTAVLCISISQLDFFSFADDCPPELSVPPCTCDIPFTSVQCAGVANVGILADVLNRSADRQFWSFALINSTVMYLPSSVIDEKNVVNLVVYDSTLASLFDMPPREDNSIMTMLLKRVMFQRVIDWRLMRPMRRLKLIRAENTDVRTLGQSFTENINAGLTDLILNNCGTRRIRYDAFAKLKDLLRLEITNAEIKSLNRSMFATPSLLEYVDFSGNAISSLPDDLFSEMPVLKKVNLSLNKIQLFSQVVFSSVMNQLSYLGIEGNPLQCDCSVLWYVSKEEKLAFDGRCSSPEDRKDKLLQDLRRSDFDLCSS